MASKRTNVLPVIGWREWVALPELGVPRIKVKVDTGARSSSLHAFDIQIYRRRGAPVVRFNIHPYQRQTRATVHAEAEMIEERTVRSSGGHETVRPVIVTTVELMGECWPIELTLVRRDEMGFRMLLGREAVRRRFLVDPGRSFLGGEGPAVRRKSAKRRRR